MRTYTWAATVRNPETGTSDLVGGEIKVNETPTASRDAAAAVRGELAKHSPRKNITSVRTWPANS